MLTAATAASRRLIMLFIWPLLALLGLGAGAAALLSSESTKPAPKSSPPALGVLEFDLDAPEWGRVPIRVREWGAFAEIITGIPGLGRALAVYWWTIWRGDEPFLGDAAEVTALAEKQPDLCLTCVTPDPRSTTELEKKRKAGWPKPGAAASWEGAFGLNGILGSTAVYMGFEDARPSGAWVRSRLPLIDAEAKKVMALWWVQAWIGAVLVWRALQQTTPPTLAADPLNTWGNVFSAILDPVAYSQGKGSVEKERYLKRAMELGVVLDVAPTKKPGALHPWALWLKAQAYHTLPFVNTGSGKPIPDEPPAPPLPDIVFVPVLPMSFGGGLTGIQVPTAIKDDATLAPLVVVLHGRDADVGSIHVPTDLNARVIALRGQISGKAGFRFIPDAQLTAKSVRAAGILVGSAIREMLAKYPTTRIVALGHDQGGAVALRLAELGLADVAIGAGTALPAALHPTRPSQARIFLIHGSKDPWPALATFTAFQKAGFATSWTTVEDAGHDIEALSAQVQAALVGSVGLPLAPAAGFSWPGCKLEVSNTGEAMRYLVPRVVDAVGTDAAPEVLAQTAFNFLAANDPNCEFPTQLDPVDGKSAGGLYLLERQVVQTLVLRGQIAAEVGKTIVDKEKDKAEKLDAPADDLLGIEM